MKKIFLLLFATVSISIVFTACNNSKSGGGDVVDLKLNLQKGKTYTYTMKTNMNMDMEVMGKPMNTTGNIDFGFRMNVEDVDAQNNYRIATTYDAIRFKMNAMGMDMGYDSKNVGDTTRENMVNGMMRKVFGGMMGKTFKITMSPKGEVLKIEGLKELVESMEANIEVSEQMKTAMHKQMSESFSEDQIKQSFAQAFSIYPDKPVKVGDSWNKNLDRDMSQVKMSQNLTFTVKEINSSAVVLELTGKIASSMGKDSTAPAMKMDLSGDEKGTMQMDRNTGMISQGDIDMDMKMSAMGKPMTMKVKTTIVSKE